MKDNHVFFSTKMPVDLRDWIKELAAKHRRSVNSELIVILEEFRRKQEEELAVEATR